MDTPIIITVVILVSLLLIAGVAWLVYGAGYRATKMKVKTPIWEADLERPLNPAQAQPVEPEMPSLRTEIRQQAGDGGKIKDSPISAPAESGASVTQKSEGQDSAITGSGIKLT